MESIINQIIPIIITAVVGILVIIIKSIGESVKALIEAKKTEVINKIGVDKFNAQRSLAYSIFNVVEEHFRITELVGDTMNAKIDMFDNLIKQNIPSITDEQIALLRQSIAGEINSSKDVILKEVK